ncbi:MAG: hypothetical protein ACR2NB_09000 [Solirubrobacteraceae bacterium]
MRPRAAKCKPIAGLCAVAVLGGTGAVVAATSGGGSDPAPPRVRGDVPGVVSVGRPITPYASGQDDAGEMVMRARSPSGGEPLSVLFHQGNREDRDEVCFETGPERALRDYPIADGGSCGPARLPSARPLAVGQTSSVGLVTITGRVGAEVTRLTEPDPAARSWCPGPGRGAFLIAYAPQVEGRVVLTARQRDGTTRYFRTVVPNFPMQPPGAATAKDPGGLPEWYATASTRKPDDLARPGQTCVSAGQEHGSPKDWPGGRIFRGGVAPACGDLRAEPVFVRAVVTGRGEPTLYNLGGRTADRVVVYGAGAGKVREVALLGPQGRRNLPLARAGHAFLAVLAADVDPDDLALDITLADATTRRINDIRAFNRATSFDPPPRLRGAITATVTARTRQVRLRATMTGTAKSFKVSFLGRPVRMCHTGGPGGAPVYTGTYDGTRGARRPLPAAGDRQYIHVVLCGGTNCRSIRARARIRHSAA